MDCPKTETIEFYIILFFAFDSFVRSFVLFVSSSSSSSAQLLLLLLFVRCKFFNLNLKPDTVRAEHNKHMKHSEGFSVFKDMR